MDTEISDGTDGCLTTSESAKSIQAIDKTTVHRICSGQVVLTLATAVKELVENSIDAGATSVEVRLRDHGSSILEVCDNGKGVEEENFEGLTLKHHTSKLRDFGDLVGVKTFGFRGEALSSLCALSNLTVVTRHVSLSVGTKLIYDHNGKLTSKTPLSRQTGTTVSIQNLFSTLPVRHKEFQRNIKKEFNKMVQVLYSYCLISTGVRIICTNQTEKGKKTVVVSTDGHNSIKENISSVFGAKQVSSVLEFKQVMASDEVLTEYGMPNSEVLPDNCLFTVEGFISSCSHGQGRSATDRQFYFINSRPCDPAKVMKLVNEVYHYHNRNQFPFVVMNIHLKEGDVDINVTPDKRQILVNHEKLMLATIKTSMLKLYENIPSTYNMQNTSLSSPLNRSFDSSQSSRSSNVATPNANSNNGKISALSLKFGRNVGGSPLSQSPGSPLSSQFSVGMKRSLSQNTGSTSPSNKQPKLESFLKSKSLPFGTSNGSCNSLESTPSSCNGILSNPQTQSGDEMGLSGSSLDQVMECAEDSLHDMNNSMLSLGDAEWSIKIESENASITSVRDKESSDPMTLLEEGSESLVSLQEEGEVKMVNGMIANHNKVNGECMNEKSNGIFEDNTHGASGPVAKSSESKKDVKSLLSKFSSTAAPSVSCKKAHNATNDFLSNLMARKSVTKKNLEQENEGDDIFVLDKREEVVELTDESDVLERVNESETSPDIDSKKKLIVYEEYNPDNYISHRKSKSVNFDMESFRKKITTAAQKKETEGWTRKFRAKIAPSDNTSAEDELRKEISKEMFAKMEILGQFNLGFIIAKLGSDLFIVDQHATDEKYNFETLQQTCVLQNQRLIIPQSLELTAVNESILLDNIDIFKTNGFEFKVDEDKCVGRRVSLTSMPFSRGWEFGKDDIEELIFMLSDAPGVMCRPSRVRAMFASRSCRKSIMIGTALTKAQMQKLVTHMGEIEQPWNCPHGRPTMRHLVNLDLISTGHTD